MTERSDEISAPVTFPSHGSYDLRSVWGSSTVISSYLQPTYNEHKLGHIIFDSPFHNDLILPALNALRSCLSILAFTKFSSFFFQNDNQTRQIFPRKKHTLLNKLRLKFNRKSCSKKRIPIEKEKRKKREKIITSRTILIHRR